MTTPTSPVHPGPCTRFRAVRPSGRADKWHPKPSRNTTARVIHDDVGCFFYGQQQVPSDSLHPDADSTAGRTTPVSWKNSLRKLKSSGRFPTAVASVRHMVCAPRPRTNLVPTSSRAIKANDGNRRPFSKKKDLMIPNGRFALQRAKRVRGFGTRTKSGRTSQTR